MTFTKLLCSLALVATCALAGAAPASAKSPIKVGIGDQSPEMFASPEFRALGIRRTRYFVPADVMQDSAERAKARAFLIAARAARVSTLLHVSTADLRSKRGPIVPTAAYRRNVAKLVAYFRPLGVTDFGAWNEVNHKTQETWNRVGNAVSYFKDMYTAVRRRCPTCTVVGLDVLDQAGVDRYIASFYNRLDKTWRKRLKVVGIHNYSDVNRNRTTFTAKIIKAVRKVNPRTKFWFTETGALASFAGSFPYSESRQAARMANMFSLATKYRAQGVDRVYSYNWFGAESSDACAKKCKFDAGLVDPGGEPRPVYDVFKSRLRDFSR